MGMPFLLCWNSKREGVRSRPCKARAERGFGWVDGWMDGWMDGCPFPEKI